MDDNADVNKIQRLKLVEIPTTHFPLPFSLPSSNPPFPIPSPPFPFTFPFLSSCLSLHSLRFHLPANPGRGLGGALNFDRYRNSTERFGFPTAVWALASSAFRIISGRDTCFLHGAYSSNALPYRQHQQSCHLANNCYVMIKFIPHNVFKIIFNTLIVTITQCKHFFCKLLHYKYVLSFLFLKQR